MSSLFRRPVVLISATGLICLFLCSHPKLVNSRDETPPANDRLMLRRNPDDDTQPHTLTDPSSVGSFAMHVNTSDGAGEVAYSANRLESEPAVTVAEARLKGLRSATDPPSQAQPEVWYSHRIVDGDTLHSLAARYLGDETRAPELFEANRDVLVYPEVLPLGTTLRIPSSR